jgi:hypothetical protein
LADTTGQRYIYAGPAEGVINAWDVVSGKPVSSSEVFGVVCVDAYSASFCFGCALMLWAAVSCVLVS